MVRFAALSSTLRPNTVAWRSRWCAALYRRVLLRNEAHRGVTSNNGALRCAQQHPTPEYRGVALTLVRFALP